MIYYNTTEARKSLNEIINKVRYQKVIISLGRHGKAEVLIVPNSVIIDENLPISQINTASSSFDFLADEAEIYSYKDIKKRYV